jgi:hypothetical protein
MTTARREPRPKEARTRFWFDPRFAIGLLLIVASVGGVVALVGAADATVQVYTARAALAPGDHIDAGDLALTDVRVDGADRLYLLPHDLTGDGFEVTKPVARGELVPASAVGSAEGARQTSVVVAVDGELAASIGPGVPVDVWSARESAAGVYDAPTVLVSAATVVRLVDTQGFVVDNGAVSIEVLVPRTRVARVLEAVANSDAISVVPSSLPGK